MEKSGTVSVIIPTYNRCELLPHAVASVFSQRYTNWELIIVDDGSTDNTRQTVKALASKTINQVVYVYQENRGPGAARNKGLKLARGEFIAFLDSDDLWRPSHLTRCVGALQKHLGLSHVFGAVRQIDILKKKRISTHNYYQENGSLHPFITLDHKNCNGFNLIVDRRAGICAIAHGIPSGLQSSVFRKEHILSRFNEDYLVGEDRLFINTMLLDGRPVGYFWEISCIQTVHDDHISNVKSDGLKKFVGNTRDLIGVYLQMKKQTRTRGQRMAVKRRIGELYGWYLGVAFEERQLYRQASLAYFKALCFTPLKLSFWKGTIANFIREIIK